MCCDDQESKDGTDKLQGEAGQRPFDLSATAWLVGEAVRYLNTADKQGELAYQRVVELLLRCGKDLLDTVVLMYRQAKVGDMPFRWNLLYVLGDAADQSAVDFLVDVALARLPEPDPDQGCEGARDMEMLVSTMAVEALQRIVARHPESGRSILRVVDGRPATPILIEAVKAAIALKMEDEVRRILPKDDHWILDIRHARPVELFAEPEREDGRERGFTPPKLGTTNSAPTIIRKER